MILKALIGLDNCKASYKYFTENLILIIYFLQTATSKRSVEVYNECGLPLEYDVLHNVNAMK